MFKEIIDEGISSEEIKNRLLAYASLQAAREETNNDYWYGNISTYTLNLRLSGIYGEKEFPDVIAVNADSSINLGKYIYLENEVFLRETHGLDNVSFVKQLYQAYLRREADPGGLQGNVNNLDNGALRKDLVVGLRNSGEADNVFLRVSDCLNDRTFIDIAYQAYLNPKHHQTRQEIDLGGLNKGKSRREVFLELKQFQQLENILASLENDFYQEDETFITTNDELVDKEFVQKLYQTYLKREADEGGLESHVQQLENGLSRRVILYALRTSEEAANVFVGLTANLDNDTFLEVAYRAYLKRELTPEIKQSYLEQLNQGKPRQSVLALR